MHHAAAVSLTAAHARLRGGGSPPRLPRAACPQLCSSLLARLQGGAGMPTGRSLPSLFTRCRACPLLCSSLPATYLSLQGISCKRFNPLLQCLEQCSAQPTHTHQQVPTLTLSNYPPYTAGNATYLAADHRTYIVMNILSSAMLLVILPYCLLYRTMRSHEQHHVHLTTSESVTELDLYVSTTEHPEALAGDVELKHSNRKCSVYEQQTNGDMTALLDDIEIGEQGDSRL